MPYGRLGVPPPVPGPPVPHESDHQPVSVPSFFAPTRTFAYIEGRAPALINSWSRSSIIFTGRPAFLASRAHARPQVSAPNLLPNPPPITGVSTRALPPGSSSARANSWLTPYKFCVEAHTVSSSSAAADHSATWPCVSRQQCVITCAPYQPSWVTSASFNPPSASPSICSASCRVRPSSVTFSCGTSPTHKSNRSYSTF